MRIYKMTATFGKLENQSLTLEPGLNIIPAPNEWGKSTWCAFLATMLYGLDTREKNTKTSLAVKDRYAPWSGSPMSGRIDLCWEGRDLTIERWTKGRTALGEFRAYETESGLAVQELTGANCGEVLLGVEKSVFLRSGFIRLADLPVTADESLRRRLNALVTTGDESGTGDILAQKLKDLKNKVRYNRTGLLPQAEAQRTELQGKLTELGSMENQRKLLQLRQTELEAEKAQLENHRVALAYAAASKNIQKVEQAHMAAEAAAEALAKAEDRCMGLPSREDAKGQLDRHALLLQEQASLVRQWDDLPPEPQPPQVPERYRDMEPEDAIAAAQEDVEEFTRLQNKSIFPHKGLLVTSLAMVAIGLLLGLLIPQPWGWIATALVLASTILAITLGHLDGKRRREEECKGLLARYPGLLPEMWVEDATLFAEQQKQYDLFLANALAQRRSIRRKMDDVEDSLNEMMGGLSSHDFLLRNNETLAAHDELEDARRLQQQAAAHAAALSAMVRYVNPPAQEDHMTYSEAETAQRLQALEFERKQLQLRLGQFEGRMEALGTEEALAQQLEAGKERISKLNQYYAALELAQQTLHQATTELQRRFAPRISQQAQVLFGKLTGGRYERIQLQQDLSISVATGEEVALREIQRRSEGTVDQLYLALRLAVSRELTPSAPLVLDDALVRFDDVRHAAAMEILRQEADEKQVILFTCQTREQ